MPRIELAPEVGEDLDRILEHLQQFDASVLGTRVEEIIQAISVLESNPLIGCPTKNELRELIIGRQSRGYVALYQYIRELDTVFILAIRSQKEAGFSTEM